jgi:hypothetical protein
VCGWGNISVAVPSTNISKREHGECLSVTVFLKLCASEVTDGLEMWQSLNIWERLPYIPEEIKSRFSMENGCYLSVQNLLSSRLSISTNKVYKIWVRFQVLTAASMKTAVFWVVAPCSLVEVYRRFRGACCLHHQGRLHCATTQKTAIFIQNMILRCFFSIGV